MKKILLAFTILLASTICSEATTYYIRTDGSTATNCLGTTDAAYDGSGTGEACALNHPAWTFPPTASDSQSKKAASGDTVVIKTGSYRVGCQNSTDCRNASFNITSGCSAGSPQSCPLGTVPSSVTIIGCSTSGCSTLAQRPELWGAGRPEYLFRVSSSGVTFRDLILTDHASCGAGHPTLSCGSTDSSELSSKRGIDGNGSTNLTLINTDAKGFYAHGIYAPNSSGLSILGDSDIDFNALAGVEFDNCNGAQSCAPSGTITLGNTTWNNPNAMWSISWNGCVDSGTGVTAANLGCYNAATSGYGDGLGHGKTSANFIVYYGKILHNTSDGLDFLYHDTGSGTIDVRNSVFGGNAGNALKASGNVVVYNSVFEGDCDFFEGKSYKNTTFTPPGQTDDFESCRASGNTVVFTFQSGTTVKFYGNTISRNRADSAIEYKGRGITCTSSNTLQMKNLIAVANNKYFGGNTVGWTINSGSGASACGSAIVTTTNSNIYNHTTNPTGTGNIYSNPSLVTTIAGSTYGAYPPSSIDIADETVVDQPSTDFNLFSRGAAWDAGALEFGSSYGGGGSPVCGDSIILSPEECDDGDTSGGDGCDSNCEIEAGYSCVGEPSVCTADCGNGNIDSGELCDPTGPNLNNQTCISQGFVSGSLACTAQCTFNTSGCVSNTCGDGNLSGEEQCDDSNTTNGDGCSAICQTEIPGLEKFLLYTETDTGEVLEVETHKVTMAGIDHTVNTNVMADKGLNFFQNYTHRFKVQIDSCNDNGAGEDGGAGLWAVSASSRTNLKDIEDNTDGITFSLSCLSSFAQHTWKLYSADNATIDTYLDTAPTITRYIEIQRSTNTVTAKIYSDVNYTNLLDTLTITTTAEQHRYIYTTLSYNSGVSSVAFSGSVENLALVTDTPPGGDCTGTTINYCVLPSLSNTQSGGACSTTGSCSYTCTAGNFVLNSNTCTPPPSDPKHNGSQGSHVGGCAF